MRRLGAIAGGALAVLALVAMIYPAVIGLIYRNDLPHGWSDELAGMTFGEIHQKIGLPHEDASEKGWVNWVIPHWWGVQVLKILAEPCCKAADLPGDIVYLVYVESRYNPVVSKYLKKGR